MPIIRDAEPCEWWQRCECNPHYKGLTSDPMTHGYTCRLAERAVLLRDTPGIRDQLAMAATQGLLAASDTPAELHWDNAASLAACAYYIADAMLTAREAKR